MSTSGILKHIWKLSLLYPLHMGLEKFRSFYSIDVVDKCRTVGLYCVPWFTNLYSLLLLQQVSFEFGLVRQYSRFEHYLRVVIQSGIETKWPVHYSTRGQVIWKSINECTNERRTNCIEQETEERKCQQSRAQENETPFAH